jgi:acyl carrier protein
MLLALPQLARGDRLLDYVSDTVAGVLGLDAGELDPDRGFFDLGMDSVLALAVRSRLEDDLGLDLSSTLTFEYPTVFQLAAHLGRRLDEMPGPLDSDAPLAAADDELVEALERSIAAANRELPPAGPARRAEGT